MLLIVYVKILLRIGIYLEDSEAQPSTMRRRTCTLDYVQMEMGMTVASLISWTPTRLLSNRANIYNLAN